MHTSLVGFSVQGVKSPQEAIPHVKPPCVLLHCTSQVYPTLGIGQPSHPSVHAYVATILWPFTVPRRLTPSPEGEKLST
jgi:hypothetical protein